MLAGSVPLFTTMNEFIRQNWIAILGVAGYGGTALISTMPPKGSKMDAQTFYAWVYDALHMMLNSRSQTPTQPAGPAKE